MASRLLGRPAGRPDVGPSRRLAVGRAILHGEPRTQSGLSGLDDPAGLCLGRAPSPEGRRPPVAPVDRAGGRRYGDEPVFERLGLAWLPPEVREGRGEIERAVRRDIPKLIEPTDVRGVLHVHTHYGDGADTLQEMMETARDLGLEYVGISLTQR